MDNADGPAVLPWLKLVLVGIYYIWLPIQIIIKFVLQAVWILVRIAALPFIKLASAIARLCLLPLAVYDKFENVLNFFGAAVLIGLFAGALTYFISNSVINVLGLSSSAVGRESTLHGHTATSFRAARAQRSKEAMKVDWPISSRSTSSEPASQLHQQQIPFTSQVKQENRVWTMGKSRSAVAKSRLSRSLPLTSTTILEETSSDTDDTILWS